MLKRRSNRLLLLMVLGAGLAQAHRLPECVTEVVWLPGDERLEISHRLHRHDAQLALERLTNDAGIKLESVESRARVALYVESRFGLRGTRPLPLSLVGAQFDGDYLWVYQEYKGPLPATISVRSEALLEWNPGQVNTVLLDLHGERRQLAMDASAGWIAVELAP